MRFLVDTCAGRRLAIWLRDEGHDAIFSDDLGSDPGDLALLEYAAAEHRVLVTVDADFGELVFVHGVAHAGLVRLPDVPMAARTTLMARILDLYADALENRAIITASTQRIRVSA